MTSGVVPGPGSGPGSGHDPARAWATEHYGFADEVDPAQTTTSTAVRSGPVRSSTPSRPRVVRLAVAGVLASVLVAGFGGAAIAAGAMDGPGAGDGAGAVDGNGAFDGGPDGGRGFDGFDGFNGDDGDGGPGGGGGGR